MGISKRLEWGLWVTSFVAFDLHSPTSFEFLDAWWRALDAGSGLFPFRRLEDESVPVFAAEPRGQCGVVDAQRFLREDRARHAIENE